MSAKGGNTLVYYYIPTDMDDEYHLNAFSVQKNLNDIKLKDIKRRFPLPGCYHFRFKVQIENNYMWVDVVNDDSFVPHYNSEIISKVLRLSWLCGDGLISVPSPQSSSCPSSSSVYSSSSRTKHVVDKDSNSVRTGRTAEAKNATVNTNMRDDEGINKNACRGEIGNNNNMKGGGGGGRGDAGIPLSEKSYTFAGESTAKNFIEKERSNNLADMLIFDAPPSSKKSSQNVRENQPSSHKNKGKKGENSSDLDMFFS